MKHTFKLIAAIALLSASAQAGDFANIAGANRIAVDGSDPVAST